MRKLLQKIIGLSFLYMSIAFLSGCIASNPNFANLKYNNDVKEQFESERIDPNYNYFYYGRDVRPDVIIGLSKDLELVSDLWKAVDLNPEQLREWRTHRFGYRWYRWSGHSGSVIQTKQGKKLGLWYSFRDWKQRARIELLSNNQIRVSSPFGGEEYPEDISRD